MVQLKDLFTALLTEGGRESEREGGKERGKEGGREGYLETIMATVCKIAGVSLPEFTHCKGILQQCLHRRTTTQSHLS